MTNKEFAEKDKKFRDACTKVTVDLEEYDLVNNPFMPTQRQASKWRNKKGLAYKYHNGLVEKS